MIPRPFLLAAGLALVTAAAGAQSPAAPRPTTAALLARCTGVPDMAACRAVLRQAADDRQRSVALTYLAESRGDSAESLLVEAVRRDPRNALARVALGSRWARNLRQDAIPHLQAALALRPDWTFLHRRIAQTFQPEGARQRDTAVALWRRAAIAEPGVASVHASLARALDATGDRAGAEASYRRALAIAPDMRAAVGELCLVLLRQQRREDAQAPCRRAIRGWGRDHGVDIRHISTYAEEMKDYGLALAATEQGLVDEPMSRYHRSDRTRILNAMGRDADALRLLREYVAAHASDWEAVEEMAEQMFWTGDVAGARAQYVRLLHPACGESRAGCSVDGRIAMASLRLGKVDDAFRELRATLETSPTCYYNVDQFQRFAAMRPDSATVLPRLRRMLDEVGEHVATHADPSDAAAWFGARGRWDRATPLLRIALDSALAEERRPNSGRRSYELRRRYGESLVAEGKYCEGLRELEASITVQPLVPGGEPYIPDALRLARERCPENRR